MKQQIKLEKTGRRAGKTFKDKFSMGSRKIKRTKKAKGG